MSGEILDYAETYHVWRWTNYAALLIIAHYIFALCTQMWAPHNNRLWYLQVIEREKRNVSQRRCSSSLNPNSHLTAFEQLSRFLPRKLKQCWLALPTILKEEK